jgi:trigger factor
MAIKENMEKSYEEQSKQDLRSEVIDKLIEQSEFELPEGLVEQELAKISQDAEALMAQRGIPLKHAGLSDEDLSDKYRPLAERKVKEYLLLEQVIKQEEISLTDEILNQATEEFAERLGAPIEDVKSHHDSDEEAMAVFKQRTLEKQAINYIIENSNLETVEAGENKEKNE